MLLKLQKMHVIESEEKEKLGVFQSYNAVAAIVQVAQNNYTLLIRK